MAAFNSSKKEKVLIEEEQEDVVLIVAIKEGYKAALRQSRKRMTLNRFY